MCAASPSLAARHARTRAHLQGEPQLECSARRGRRGGPPPTALWAAAPREACGPVCGLARQPCRPGQGQSPRPRLCHSCVAPSSPPGGVKPLCASAASLCEASASGGSDFATAVAVMLCSVQLRMRVLPRAACRPGGAFPRGRAAAHRHRVLARLAARVGAERVAVPGASPSCLAVLRNTRTGACAAGLEPKRQATAGGQAANHWLRWVWLASGRRGSS